MLDYKPNNSTRKGILIFLVVILACVILVAGLSFLVSKKDHFGSNKIAVIRVEGIITDAREVLEQFNEYELNQTVKAIVLRVDSPGGGVGPSQEIYERIVDIQKKGSPKVIVSMGSVAASGGYYISCAADKVVANPGSLTGSIVVIMEFANVQELFKKIGRDTVVIKTGEFKDLGNPTRTMTPAEKQLLQGVIDDVYQQFVDAISRGRKLNTEKVRAIADGRIFSGKQAKELGLVDELGGLERALEIAADMVGIKQRPLEILEREEQFSWKKFLSSISRVTSIGYGGSFIPQIKSSVSLDYRL